VTRDMFAGYREQRHDRPFYTDAPDAGPDMLLDSVDEQPGSQN
jgi:hypothetical protein